jgi:hypothetical protein
MKILRTVLSFAILLTTHTVLAQAYRITGRIIDQNDTSATLPGVAVIASPSGDTSQKNGTVTDADGYFFIDVPTKGSYKIRANYIGFTTLEKNLTITDSITDLGTVVLVPAPTTLQNVIVTGKQIRAEQLGDTTQFNANAYKTNPDANAEDLLNKMPGVTTENGKLKVGGEDVKQILVDGKPFFGDDPASAVKNLPSEIIDKIQVFDKLSDQSQFTGFNDGDQQKTINIITKPGRNNGNFGKVYAGYGTDDRYIAGGNVNFFKGDTRISLIVLSNNINQQNFNSEDLLGVVGNPGGQSRGGGTPGGAGNFRGGRGGRGGGGSDVSDFLVGQQGGITATNAIGLNYSDNWGKKVKASGSYFYNSTNNTNNSRIERQYFTSADSNLFYKEQSTTNAKNQNHRVNFRLEYTIDSFNSIIATPRLSLQQNENTTVLSGINTLPNEVLNSKTENSTRTQNTGYSISNNMLYRHRFAKKGRTISVGLRSDLNAREGEGSIYSLSEFIQSDTALLDQKYTTASAGHTLSSNLNYTEPITDKSQIQIEYRPSYTLNNADKQTNNRDITTGSYTDFDTLLSNKYNNAYTSHRAGLSYRYNHDKINFSAGVNGQYAILDGQQDFPRSFSINRTFRNILPNAMLNYKFTKGKNLRVFYRTSTNEPNVSQLQNVVDISNPLLLRTGNANLVQSYEHRSSINYSATDSKTGRSFFALLFANYMNDYIGTQTIIPRKDTVVDNILINRGGQLSRPVNIDGYFNGRSFITYGFPVDLIKSNLNLNAGINYARTPALINNRTNFSNNYGLNGGFTLGSNINENIDFSLSYSANYNIVKNTIQTTSDNSYYTQNTSLKLNYIFLKGFVFNTTLNHYLYNGLSQDFNQNFLLWNASLGYKFLKNRALEAKVSVYDILNQNRAIARTVTETYIEDSYTNVLQQYFMFTLTYTLRNFKAAANKQ